MMVGEWYAAGNKDMVNALMRVKSNIDSGLPNQINIWE